MKTVVNESLTSRTDPQMISYEIYPRNKWNNTQKTLNSSSWNLNFPASSTTAPTPVDLHETKGKFLVA